MEPERPAGNGDGDGEGGERGLATKDRGLIGKARVQAVALKERAEAEAVPPREESSA